MEKGTKEEDHLRSLMQVLNQVNLANLQDEEKLEELQTAVFQYGSSLGASDLLGREVFVQVALILHEAQLRITHS